MNFNNREMSRKTMKTNDIKKKINKKLFKFYILFLFMHIDNNKENAVYEQDIVFIARRLDARIRLLFGNFD